MQKTLIVIMSLMLIACGEKPKPAEPPKQTVQTKPGPCNDPVYLTNDEIIDLTRKCESAGLDAQGMVCGDDGRFVTIQCKPRKCDKPEET